MRVRETGSNKWSFGFETPLTHAGVVGLKPDTEYEFSVAAKNAAGESDPAITRVRTNPDGGTREQIMLTWKSSSPGATRSVQGKVAGKDSENAFPVEVSVRKSDWCTRCIDTLQRSCCVSNRPLLCPFQYLQPAPHSPFSTDSASSRSSSSRYSNRRPVSTLISVPLVANIPWCTFDWGKSSSLARSPKTTPYPREPHRYSCCG